MTPRTLLLIASLALFWGPAFMFMKFALQSFSPVTIAALRVSIGASLLYIVLRLRGGRLRPYLKYWKHFAMMGFFASALPFCLFPTSELYISSSLAGIINSSTPIFTVILAHYFVAEKITFRKMLGISIGMIGIILIFLPSLFDAHLKNELGIILATLASISYAIGMVYAKRHLKDLPYLVAPAYQLTFAALFTIPFSILIDCCFGSVTPTPIAIFGILGLGIFSTTITFSIYYTIIRVAGASYLSMSTLLFPIVAVSLGYIFLDETLSWYSFVGAGLIISGLFISSPLLKKRTP